jgi:hypothetical protein
MAIVRRIIRVIFARNALSGRSVYCTARPASLSRSWYPPSSLNPLVIVWRVLQLISARSALSHRSGYCTEPPRLFSTCDALSHPPRRFGHCKTPYDLLLLVLHTLLVLQLSSVDTFATLVVLCVVHLLPSSSWLSRSVALSMADSCA